MPLPDGTGPIGIAPSFQVEVGLKLEYSAGRTRGGALINNVLKPFGYVATAEANDGDHIVEMRIAGPNELRNLWPLNRSENRSSETLLRNAIPEAKEKVKPGPNAPANRDSFYIIITETRT